MATGGLWSDTGVWGHRRSGLAPSPCCVSPVTGDLLLPPCPGSCPARRFWDAQDSPQLLAPARLHPRGCASTAGFWGGFWSLLAGRQLCLCPMARDVLCGPLPGQPAQNSPGRGASLALCGAIRQLCCGCRHSFEVFGVFCTFLLQSITVRLRGLRAEVWQQDGDEEQEFSSHSCQDF